VKSAAGTGDLSSTLAIFSVWLGEGSQILHKRLVKGYPLLQEFEVGVQSLLMHAIAVGLGKAGAKLLDWFVKRVLPQQRVYVQVLQKNACS